MNPAFEPNWQRNSGDHCVAVGSAVFVRCPRSSKPTTRFECQSDLVLVNVTVRDKSGNFVRDLKPEDFTILEDNKPQKVVSFDVENIDAVANQNVAQAKPLPGQLLSQQSVQSRATAASGRRESVQGSPPHRSVLRSLRHGARRNRSRDHFGGALC